MTGISMIQTNSKIGWGQFRAGLAPFNISIKSYPELLPTLELAPVNKDL